MSNIPLSELRAAQQAAGYQPSSLTVDVPNATFLSVGPPSPSSPSPSVTPTTAAAAAARDRDRAAHQLLMSPQSNAAALADIRARVKARDAAAANGSGSSAGTDGRGLLASPHSRSMSVAVEGTLAAPGTPNNGMASIRRASIGNASELLASRRVAKKREKAAAAAMAEQQAAIATVTAKQRSLVPARSFSAGSSTPTATSATVAPAPVAAGASNGVATTSVFVRPTPTAGTTLQSPSFVGEQKQSSTPSAAGGGSPAGAAVTPKSKKHITINDDDDTAMATAVDDDDEEMKEAVRLAIARLPTKREEKLNVANMLSYIFFLVFFTLATFFARGDQSAFYLVDRMKAIVLSTPFAAQGGGDKQFPDIASVDDIWLYVNGTLLEVLLQEKYNNGTDKPAADMRWLNNNFMLGGIRFRQQRVQPWSCSVPSGYRTTLHECYGEFGSDTEERASFGGPDDDRYTWSSSDELDEAMWIGQLDNYPGSGYVVDLPLMYDNATALAKELQDDGFIATPSRVLFIDFLAYNPANNLHFVSRLAFEMPSTGGVRPLAEFYALKMDRYTGSGGIAQMVFEILVILCIFKFVFEEFKEARGAGFRRYVKDSWNVLDWINILVFFCVIGLRIRVLILSAQTSPVTNPQYTSVWWMTTFMTWENYLTSINAFLLWIKLFKYLHFNPRIQFLYRAFSTASSDLFYFTILFCVFFLAFAHAGYVAFSTTVREFRSFQISFVSLFKAVVGGMDYDALAEASRYYGPFYFVTFQIVVLLIMVNVFLAIMNDAYTAVRLEDSERADLDSVKFGLGPLVKQAFVDLRAWFGKRTKKENRTLVEAIKTADSNKDQHVDANELENAINRADPTADKSRVAKAMMQTFDTDKDGKLDRMEFKRLQSNLVNGMGENDSSTNSPNATMTGNGNGGVANSNGNGNGGNGMSNAADRAAVAEQVVATLAQSQSLLNQGLERRLDSLERSVHEMRKMLELLVSQRATPHQRNASHGGPKLVLAQLPSERQPQSAIMGAAIPERNTAFGAAPLAPLPPMGAMMAANTVSPFVPLPPSSAAFAVANNTNNNPNAVTPMNAMMNNNNTSSTGSLTGSLTGSDRGQHGMAAPLPQPHHAFTTGGVGGHVDRSALPPLRRGISQSSITAQQIVNAQAAQQQLIAGAMAGNITPIQGPPTPTPTATTSSFFAPPPPSSLVTSASTPAAMSNQMGQGIHSRGGHHPFGVHHSHHPSLPPLGVLPTLPSSYPSASPSSSTLNTPIPSSVAPSSSSLLPVHHHQPPPPPPPIAIGAPSQSAPQLSSQQSPTPTTPTTPTTYSPSANPDSPT